MQFGIQDYHIKQLQKTLAYAKTLHHWVEKAQTPMPDKPCQLAECVWELRDAMEPLTMFMDAEIFGEDVPPNWVKITSSRTSQSMEPTNSQEQSCSQNHRAWVREAFMMTSGVGQLKPSATTPAKSSLTALTQRVQTQPESTIVQQWMPLPGFVDIAKILHRDNPTWVVTGVPPELAETGPYPNHRVDHVFHQAAAGYGLRCNLYWHDDLHHEPGGIDIHPASGRPLNACPPRGRNWLWLSAQPTKWRLAAHSSICSPVINSHSLFTSFVLNCLLSFLGIFTRMCLYGLYWVFTRSILSE